MSAASDSPPVAIVGAGAMGTALGKGLAACGYEIKAVLSRTQTSARDLSDRVDAPVASSSAEALPEDVRFVFLCVPDDAIEAVADSLATVRHPWEETIVAHTSGARTTDVLDALTQTGAATLSFHPIQSFTEDAGVRAWEDVVLSLEGDDRALVAGETLARALGSHLIVASKEEKLRYHCAAVLASNGLVALMGVVEELLAKVSSDMGSSSVDVVGPLVEQTLENVKCHEPDAALTGPVARGDEETVTAHLQMLASDAPHLIPFYLTLSTEMVRTAVRGGKLQPEQAERLLDLLGTAAEASATDDNPPMPSH